MLNSAEAEPAKPRPRGRKDPRVVVIEKIESEGDRQLKALAQKQLDVDTTLREQLLKRKVFTSPAIQENAAVSGSLSLAEYKKKADYEKRVEELRAYRLTSEEIQLVIHQEQLALSDEPQIKRSKYGVDPSITQSRLKEIYVKMKDHDIEVQESGNFSGIKTLNRHEMDLERAILSRNNETKTLSNMLIGPSDQSHRQSSNVQNLLGDINERLNNTRTRDIQIGDREMNLSSQEDIDNTNLEKAANQCPRCLKLRDTDRGIMGPLSREEMKSFEYCTECLRVNNQVNTDSKKQEDSAVTECAENLQKSVVIGNEESIPEEVIRKYRLSLSQIRELPRFADYRPGEKNKTLYLKNLSSKVTEEDLASLFVRFQQPDSKKIVFKLMRGKMRGQGFVTFPDQNTAEEALELVNGYDFKGKPIIIQFAKKH